MALEAREAVCTECNQKVFGVPRRSFLGFLKFGCGKCGKTFLYPLTRGYRIFCWVFVVMFMALFVVLITRGQIVAPGLLVIAGLIALAKDASLKRRVAEAERQAEATDPQEPV